MTRLSLLIIATLKLFSFMGNVLFGQIDLGYQTPPSSIVDLVDAQTIPSVSISPDRNYLLLLENANYPSIEEVSQEELRLGGLRINPVTNGPSRSRSYVGLSLTNLNGDQFAINGLPKKLKIENFSWAPNGQKIAFTNTISDGIELWVIDLPTLSSKKIEGVQVNYASRGLPFKWLSDSQHLLVKSIPENRGAIPKKNSIPSGPIVQENNGKVAAVRTYQDLLSNKYEEALFDYFLTTNLIKINVTEGSVQKIAGPSIITSFDPSPNGAYIMVTELKKPYSYLVPYYRFPQNVNLYDKDGSLAKKIAEIPLSDNIPKGFGAVRTGPRSFSWRSDKPASIYWVEALDGGDPKSEVAFRDRLFSLEMPFNGEPKKAIDFKLRYSGINWGTEAFALAYEYWWTTRQAVVSKWNPENPAESKSTIFDYSREDRYNDPGTFQTTINQNGRRVLLIEDSDKLYLTGQGASPEGNRPFIDQYELSSKKTTRLWRSDAPFYEYPVTILDANKGTFISRKESRKAPPNYFLNNIATKHSKPLTSFENPYQALEGVKKELIKYEREDGVSLTGTLYLPKDYNKEKDGPLPTLMWAYPREYKSAAAAGQVSGSPYQFVRLYYGSPIFWVTQGYAVFDNFAMPIIGEGEDEPNETFVEQLSMGAKAAIDKLAEMGVTDRERVGVGGHSYGAFMVANLLAHTDYFAAGIARSGAYNRTLTPFGFQREERTFWEAPEVYFKMSPFMFADKIKEPILLIHGEADNNSGTFPLQSKRFYAALKGHGTKARLVMLPHESHGYRARESVLHMLWEMNQWLDSHVKHKQQKEKLVKP